MKYIILVLVLLTSFSTFAELSCSKNGTRIIYTNGVDTSPENAKDSLDKIKILKKSQIKIVSLIDKKILDPIVAYNYSATLAKDVLESAVQRLPQSYLNALKVRNAYHAFSHFLQGDLLSLSADIVSSINIATLQLISTFSQSFFDSALYQRTISKGIPLYLSAIKNKEKIFAISHSQGGLFMKDFYDLIPESDYKRKFYSGFQIASPLQFRMNSHFGYATNSEDEVINKVRLTIGALPPNLITYKTIFNNEVSDFGINHGILSTYLFDPELRIQVEDNLIETAQLLESNCNTAAIKITKQENLKVDFDSKDPNDEDVTNLKYVWNFGEGLGDEPETDSKEVSHSYAKAGTYDVILKVFNNDGDTDSKTISVTVVNASAPQAVIQIKAQENLKVSFDSIGNTGLTGLTYAWIFGDGQKSSLKSPIHNYSKQGTFSLRLTVTDASGASATTTAKISVKGLLFNINLTSSFYHYMLLVEDTAPGYRIEAHSLSMTANVTGELGTLIKMSNYSGRDLREMTCGSWIKAIDLYKTPTCTRGPTSPETTSITVRTASVCSGPNCYFYRIPLWVAIPGEDLNEPGVGEPIYPMSSTVPLFLGEIHFLGELPQPYYF